MMLSVAARLHVVGLSDETVSKGVLQRTLLEQELWSLLLTGNQTILIEDWLSLLLVCQGIQVFISIAAVIGSCVIAACRLFHAGAALNLTLLFSFQFELIMLVEAPFEQHLPCWERCRNCWQAFNTAHSSVQAGDQMPGVIPRTA